MGLSALSTPNDSSVERSSGESPGDVDHHKPWRPRHVDYTAMARITQYVTEASLSSQGVFDFM